MTIARIIALSALGGCGATGPLTHSPYRLPYANGVDVRVVADDLTHGSPAKNMFDFAGVKPEQVLVAAAPGWVRFIEDGNDVGGNANNNYVWIEHPLDYCQPPTSESLSATTPSTCKSCPRGLGKCNEWTLTVHMRKNSVTAAPPLGAGLSKNEWVDANQAIGIEGAVGFVIGPSGARCSDTDFMNDALCGRHAHFNVFVFDVDATGADDVPTDNGDYEAYATRLSQRPERVPPFCTRSGLRFVRMGEVHMAAPCSALP
jgi:hypothetical protein